MSAEICKEVGLPFVHFMQYSDPVCNPCGRKIRILGQFYHFMKTVNTSTASIPRLRAANILLPRRTKPAQHSKFVRVNSRATKTLSIKGSTSATKGKSRTSLSFSLLEKIKKPKSLIYPYFANKTNELGPA